LPVCLFFIFISLTLLLLLLPTALFFPLFIPSLYKEGGNKGRGTLY
jgi:hypothetical protein